MNVRPPPSRFDRALLVMAALVLVCAFAFTPKKKVVFKKTAIVFSQWWEDEMDEGSLAALIKEFEADNPAVQVSLDSRSKDDVGRLLRQGSGALRADLAALDPYWIENLRSKGMLRPLPASFFEAEREDEEAAGEAGYAPEGESALRYAVPLVSFVNLLFYNTPLLRAAGLDRPPKTREDFLDACKKISSGSLGVFGFALSDDVWTDCLPWFWQAGVKPPSDGGADTAAFFALPASRATLGFLRGLYEAQALVPPPFGISEAQKIQAFSSARAAMMIAGVQAARKVRLQNPALEFSVTGVPPPGNHSARPVFNVQGWYAGLPADSAHSDAALLLLEFLYDRRAAISRAAGALPYSGAPGQTDAALPDELYAKAQSIAASADIQEDYDVFAALPRAEETIRGAVRGGRY